MNTFDLTPLYRTAIGYDRLADMLTRASRADGGNGYPPYNIEAVGDDDYRITMAVAGFAENELNIVSEQNTLTVSGAQKPSDDNEHQFLYRGIATRSFERRFQLADHVRVEHASLENGLLHIELRRELPEQMKPRTISINGKESLIESQEKSKAA